MIFVHVRKNSRGIGGQRIRRGALPVVAADPGHAAVAADVAHGADLELKQSEVGEVGVVRGIGMHGAERGARPIGRFSVEPRTRTEQRDATAGQRIAIAGFGNEQRGARIGEQVLGVLGQRADEKNRIAAVEREGDEGAVGIALGLAGGERTQAAGLDAAGQGARVLGVAGRRYRRIVQQLLALAAACGIVVSVHDRALFTT